VEAGHSRSLYVALKARSGQMVNHAIAAALLLAAAVSAVRQGHHVLWALAEGVVAATLIASVIRDLQKKRTTDPSEHVHDHLGWVEIITGLFLGVEAYTRTLGPHHVSFVVMAFVPAFVLVAIGVFEARIARKFFVRADDDHLTSRIGRRSRFSVAWSDIERLESTRKALLVHVSDGTVRRIPFGGVWRGDFVRDWILSRAGEHGVGVIDDRAAASTAAAGATQ
jgi:hypothetical protein